MRWVPQAIDLAQLSRSWAPSHIRGSLSVKEKELRLALVCYGGVSLVLYMHGVIKEILKLARASKAYHSTANPER